MMITRRLFLAFSGGTTLSLCARSQQHSSMLAQISGVTMDPASIQKFSTPLLIPPVMPKAGQITLRGGKSVDAYEISLRQFSQQILPAGLPATTVWGYGAVAADAKKGVLLHHAPSLTIEADYNRPVSIKWINELKDASGNYLPHLLPVDPTLHWANPPGGTAGRDMHPTFTSTPSAYTGPVPMIPHLHGAVGVGDESDGYPQSWFLPDAANIPTGYARQGGWYDYLSALASSRYGLSWGPGYARLFYPNKGRAATDWYHDHSLGMTRLNVYAGPAGFFIIRGGPGGDGDVRDSRTNLPAVLPGPGPKANDGLSPNKTYYEFPMAIQDRAFKPDGSLFYPNTRELFDGITGPYVPTTDMPPIWNPEFFGNTIIVNGNTWPFHTVEQRRYRLRVLNGCLSRFLILDFSSITGVQVWQIGNEGGLLAAAVPLTANYSNRLLMAPAERADLIVDFSGVPAGQYILRNVGPDEPFGGGVPGVDFQMADAATTGKIMQLRVVPSLTADTSTPPQFLVLPQVARLGPASFTRRLVLAEARSVDFPDAPVAGLLGTVASDASTWASWSAHMWDHPVTENPAPGATEIWELYNTTDDAHPIHVHTVKFEVFNRQGIDVDRTNQKVQLKPGTVRPPEPGETGTKDTVIAYPGEVTRLKVRFGAAGQFVWHCHLVEHEDNEMMRPMRIGPLQPGQPS